MDCCICADGVASDIADTATNAEPPSIRNFTLLITAEAMMDNPPKASLVHRAHCTPWPNG